MFRGEKFLKKIFDKYVYRGSVLLLKFGGVVGSLTGISELGLIPKFPLF
jgi:hypothetical protein